MNKNSLHTYFAGKNKSYKYVENWKEPKKCHGMYRYRNVSQDNNGRTVHQIWTILSKL